MKSLYLILLLVCLACLVAAAEVQYDVGANPNGGNGTTAKTGVTRTTTVKNLTTAKPSTTIFQNLTTARPSTTTVQRGTTTARPKETPWGDDHFYCVKKDRWGHQCVVASCEHSPCARGGYKTGCDRWGNHCTGCFVNHQKSGWMYNQMSGWCRGQGGWIVHNMGGWRHCQ